MLDQCFAQPACPFPRRGRARESGGSCLKIHQSLGLCVTQSTLFSARLSHQPLVVLSLTAYLRSQPSGALAAAKAVLYLTSAGSCFGFNLPFFFPHFPCFCFVFLCLPTPPFPVGRLVQQQKTGREGRSQPRGKKDSDRRTDTLLLVSKHAASATSNVAEVAPRTFALSNNWFGFGFVFNFFSMPLSNTLESGGETGS